jgi:hypothetical protein
MNNIPKINVTAMEDWWAAPVKEIYRVALDRLDGYEEPLVSGPGHIAWADGNFTDEDIRFCLVECASRRSEWLIRFGEPALAVAYTALEQLLAVPERVRDCDPYFP